MKVNYMQRYFNLVNLHFDQNDLFAYYQENKNSWAKYGKHDLSSLHTQYAQKECKSISKIVNQFQNPNIIENIKFFKVKGTGSISPHSDSRNVAINIPVQTNNKNYTVFYNATDEYETPEIRIEEKTSSTRAKRYINAAAYDYLIIKHAICLNTALPHGVINESEEDRIILSISFTKKYDNFEIIKELHNKNNLLKNYDK